MTRRTRSLLIAVAVLVLLGAGIAYEAITTAPVRGALRVFINLVALGNRLDLPDNDRLALARSLCSSRYLAKTPLSLSSEGGIKGFPRAIDKNYQAWPRVRTSGSARPSATARSARSINSFMREENGDSTAWLPSFAWVAKWFGPWTSRQIEPSPGASDNEGKRGFLHV